MKFLTLTLRANCLAFWNKMMSELSSITLRFRFLYIF
jgi:hypothetical protein